MPRPTRNSAWVVVPRWSRPAARAARLDRGDVDVGGQVLAADVDVRVVVDAMAEVGAERAVATPDRVVELGGGIAVVDEQERRRARGRPPPSATHATDAPGRSRRAGPRRAATPSSARRAARAGRRRVGLDVDERAVARPDEDLAQGAARGRRLGGPGGRRGPRWRGRTRRSASALGGAATETRAVAGRLEPRRDGLEPARLDLDRVVAQARLRGPDRSAAEAVEDRERERPRPGAVFAEDERRPAGRAGPRRPRRPGRARPRRSGGPPGRSGSRRRDRGAPPRPGSSRRRGRTARGP